MRQCATPTPTEPADVCSVVGLSLDPFDGQTFIDFAGIKWVFDGRTKCWQRKGRVDSVPLADSTTTGLLSARDKFLLDGIPPAGGGFAIVTKPVLNIPQPRTKLNPDQVIFGDVILTSDSLDIDCVFADGRKAGPGCTRMVFKESDDQPPGFDLNFSETLLKTLCVEIPGSQGPRGPKGVKGQSGKDGTGDGPKGTKGPPGRNATVRIPLTRCRVEDVEDVFDTAVVRTELRQELGKLFLTKARMNIRGEDAAAEQLIATRIARDVKFTGDCFKYEIRTIPCRPNDDLEDPDPVIGYFPNHFDQDDADRTYQVARRRLSDLVNDLVDHHQKELDRISDQYDEELEKFIKEHDRAARTKLDQLGDRLAECENITYLEYCLSPFECKEGRGGQNVVVDVPAGRPECAAIADALGKTGADCQILDSQTLVATNPVFSFKSVERQQISSSGTTKPPGAGLSPPTFTKCKNKGGCCIINSRGLALLIPFGGFITPGWTVTKNRACSQQKFAGKKFASLVASGIASPPPRVEGVNACNSRLQGCALAVADNNNTYLNALTSNLNRGVTVYRKSQFRSGPSTTEFPPGTYAFVYLGGAFRQERNPGVDSVNETTAIPGPFNDYWVGNEGGGTAQGPVFVVDHVSNSRRPVTTAVATTEIGLEIGFAPTSYQELIPEDFLTSHRYEPAGEVGEVANRIPYSRTDFDALITPAMQAQENLIQWKPFPTVQGSKTDKESIESAYLQGLVTGRMVTFETTQPGLFFARVKTAYSILTFNSALLMPPVKRDQNGDFSDNRPLVALLSDPTQRSRIPVVHARPVAEGQVQVQVVKVGGAPTGQGA